MNPDTWRWLIGGLATASTLGIGWLVKSAWTWGATLARIEARLGSHGELHDRHASQLDSHDGRIRLVETKVAQHSGRWEAES